LWLSAVSTLEYGYIIYQIVRREKLNRILGTKNILFIRIVNKSIKDLARIACIKAEKKSIKSRHKYTW
jgi:hypothetical protein